MTDAFALLFVGHCLADFVLQTRAMVLGKEREPRWLLAHALVVLAVQALVLVPAFPGFESLVAVTLVALLHLGLDHAKIRVQRRFGRRLTWFVLDQLLHLATLVGAAALLERAQVALEPRFAMPASWAWTIGLYAFNVHGGSAIVGGVLQRSRPPAEPVAGSPGVGQTIGILERMVMLSFVLLGQWSALGFVLTAKSVARFKELENKEFAETYLVGTLTSFLVAGSSGLLLARILGS